MLNAEPLLEQMQAVRAEVVAEVERRAIEWGPRLRTEQAARSAENLAAYLALRRRDLTGLQQELRLWGLSTLGRSESRVMASLDAVIATLATLATVPNVARPTASAFEAGAQRLERNATALFGPHPDGHHARIMVTLEPDVGLDAERLSGLLRDGVDSVRINCAHDGAEAWRGMAETVRRTAAAAGRSCPILMDLAGPKIRTRAAAWPEERRRIEAGDILLMHFGETPAAGDGFSVACSLVEALRQVPAGAEVALDDGAIVGRVEAIDSSGLRVRVSRTKPRGTKLKDDKGINFPGTPLQIAPLTTEDLAALDVVASAADMVGYSFVQRAEDVARLRAELAARRGELPPQGLVAKIETQLAFANLPEIVVEAMGSGPFGVMIARGDLAVEIGFARLSEVQEEILWLCEAAQVPVIWATQVLESLVKNGMPARGEFTDAAMGARAECVMLNKGVHLAEGVRALDDILRRARRHFEKKSPMLTQLHAWPAPELAPSAAGEASGSGS